MDGNNQVLTIILGAVLSFAVLAGLFFINKRKNVPKTKPAGRRVPTGVHGMDQTIQGGLIPNSLNLISGGAGTGKTVFGMQFIYFGALLGDPGVYVSFEEKKDDLIKDAREFGWDFEELEKKGKIKIIYFSPYDLGHFEDDITDAIKKVKAKRVVIDTFSALGMGIESSGEGSIYGLEIKKLLSHLEDTIKGMGCTALLMSEISGEVPLDITKMTKFSKYEQEEYICDSVIILHYGLMPRIGERYLRIVKMRRTNHVRMPMPFKISNRGMKKGVIIGG